MIDITNKLKAAFLFSMIISLYVSISLTVMIIILGFLFIPPLAVIIYTFLYGSPMLLREIGSVLSSGKDFFLISVSKKYITLEPQFR